ncbi:MAG: cation transporter, partial [Firmicutes bacterium]|nr:cation transporter [Bacillota bacterium]
MKFKVTGMTCSACASHVEKAVLSVEGVNSVSVSLLTNSMLVEFGPPATAERICSAVSKAGYKAYSEKTDKKALKNDGDESGTGKIALRLTVSVVLLIILMYISMGHVMWNFPLPFEIGKEPMVIAICELLLSALIIIINQRFFISGFKSLLHGSPNMDTLVALGSGASFSYSVAVLFRMCYLEKSEAHHLLHELYFESAAMILVLITVGKLLEAFSKGKTTSAVQ